MIEYDALTPEEIRQTVLTADEPAVLRGVARDWPLVRATSDAERRRLIVGDDGAHVVNAFVAPPEVEGRYFYSDDLRGFNFERRQLPLSELVDTVLALRDDPRPPGVYAGAIPLTGPLARLAQDHPPPLPGLPEDRLVSLWFGNRGRTATHWDLPENLAIVATGERRFRLFPPDQLANLYMGPLEHTLAGQPVSLVDPLAPDLERFPRYADAAQQQRIALLAPGDAIYIPSLWFHHVESLSSVGGLINLWWRYAAAHMVTPLFTLLHAMLTLKDLPQIERAHWQRLFNHYVFERDDQALAHLPDHAQGFLGDMTDEKAQRLRAFLVHSLGGGPARR